MFSEKGVLKTCSKFTGEHPCGSVILIKSLCSFIEIALLYGCLPVNLLHIFRAPFLKNITGWLLLKGRIHRFTGKARVHLRTRWLVCLAETVRQLFNMRYVGKIFFRFSHFHFSVSKNLQD